MEIPLLVKCYLYSAGWYSSRKISTHTIKIHLQEEGYYFHSCVDIFLSSFGNIKINYFDKHNITIEHINFYISKAIEDFFIDNIQEYNKYLNKELCLIGSIYNNNMALLMSEDGKVYAGVDNYLIWIGNTGIEAITNICLCKPTKTLLS
jgi:hypothetical protein